MFSMGQSMPDWTKKLQFWTAPSPILMKIGTVADLYNLINIWKFYISVTSGSRYFEVNSFDLRVNWLIFDDHNFLICQDIKMFLTVINSFYQDLFLCLITFLNIQIFWRSFLDLKFLTSNISKHVNLDFHDFFSGKTYMYDKSNPIRFFQGIYLWMGLMLEDIGLHWGSTIIEYVTLLSIYQFLILRYQ